MRMHYRRWLTAGAGLAARTRGTVAPAAAMTAPQSNRRRALDTGETNHGGTSMRHHHPWAPAALLAVATAILAAGCGSSPATQASASTTGHVGTASPTASSDSSTPTATQQSRCHSNMLTATMTYYPGGAAAGRRAGWLTLTNSSSTSCRVYGYPGLQLVTSTGTTIPTTVTRSTTLNGPPVLVPLAPGASAYVLMTWEGVPAPDEPQHGDCEPRPATIKVIPPDETTQISATWPTDPVCYHGHLTTGAFHPGKPPSQ